MNIPKVERPAHVPVHLVYEFDFYSPPGAEDDVHLAWKRLHETAPDIFWTPFNGGHWIATRAEDIEVMQREHERFSHAEFMLPRYTPQIQPLPLNLDPPQHGAFRGLIQPTFSPRAIQRLTEHGRTTAIALIEEIAPRGECEFVSDFAKVLPIVVFLGIVDLPEQDRQKLLPLAEVMVRSADPAEKLHTHEKICAYLSEWIEKRTREPGEDVISKIAHASVGGRRLTTSEVLGMCSLLLVGGLDTVAGMLSFTAYYLAQHPELRRELREHSELMPNAIEELMRRHGLPNTARVITGDFEYKGIQFKKGDMIQLPKVLYNLDERVIERPLVVDFHRRTPIPNATFGAGPHKCPGAPLARNELRIFLEEWLKRIPEFELKSGFKPQMVSGMVNGIRSVELVWK